MNTLSPDMTTLAAPIWTNWIMCLLYCTVQTNMLFVQQPALWVVTLASMCLRDQTVHQLVSLLAVQYCLPQ